MLSGELASLTRCYMRGGYIGVSEVVLFLIVQNVRPEQV